MNRFHIKAAYTEQPLPPDLPETERAAYIALTVIYRCYRSGVLPQEHAEVFKEQLVNWDTCPPMARAAQIQFAFANEVERGQEGADVWENLRILFIEYGMLMHQRFVYG